MPARLIPFVVAGLVTVIAVTVVLLLRTSVNRTVRYDKVAAPAVYIGRHACIECHARENELWTGSHHDLAMQPASPDTVLGDFGNVSFTHRGVTSSFSQRDGGFFVRTDGPDGELTEYRVTHTFGVTPLQQYLVEFPGGRRQVLPLCWDARDASEGGGRWFHLYPDETISHGDELHWTGPNQNWNFMCAECHSTNLQRGYDLQADAYDTTWSEIDVSCEACHGPGSMHVAWANLRPSSPDDGSRGLGVRLRDSDGGGWVMDMATGNAKRTVTRQSHAQVDTCAQCHARRLQIHDDDRPGQPLLDTLVPALLTQRLYHADGQILGEVYVYGSFVQSKMYREGVTCNDCHEPHGLTLLAEGNALCAKCHLPDRYDSPKHHFHEAATPGASCVECHMPSRTYMVVDPRRDHSMRVPRPDLTLTLGTPNACTGCHADRSARWAADTVDGWYPARPPHYGTALHAGRTGAPDAGVALAALIADTDQPAIARATALSLLTPSAPGAWAATVEAGLGDTDPLVRVAALDAMDMAGPDDRLRLAVPLLDDPIRAVRTRAARVLAPLAARVTDPVVRLVLDRVLDEYIETELANADRPESHVNLGNFYGEQQRFTQAESSYMTALRLDPDHAPACVNLADLYRVQGRDDLGEPLLRRAIATRPDLAASHHALGLLLARQDRTPEAVDALRRAAGLDPDNLRFGYVYAVALHSSGRAAKAITELESVHRRHPADREVLAALAMFSRDAGPIDAAIRFAETLDALAPNDVAAAQLLAQLRASRRSWCIWATHRASPRLGRRGCGSDAARSRPVRGRG